MHAMLPSMLLQPLIENAIKYAVSPQEEGAQIALSARVVGQRLRIAVEDTGPGASLIGAPPGSLDQAPVPGAPVSTGVGLVNIQNRLTQGYGDNHLFETSSQPGGGFSVMIEIPFEPDARFTPAPAEQRTAEQEAASPDPQITQESASTPEVGAPDNVIKLNRPHPPKRVTGNP